jgi:hypothetical protein
VDVAIPTRGKRVGRKLSDDDSAAAQPGRMMTAAVKPNRQGCWQSVGTLAYAARWRDAASVRIRMWNAARQHRTSAVADPDERARGREARTPLLRDCDGASWMCGLCVGVGASPADGRYGRGGGTHAHSAQLCTVRTGSVRPADSEWQQPMCDRRACRDGRTLSSAWMHTAGCGVVRRRV